MDKTVIATPDAPAAIGPYSQGIAGNGLVFVSGQLPVDPKTGAMPETIEAQARQSLTNLKAIIEASGSSLDKVVKTTCFLADSRILPLSMPYTRSSFRKTLPHVPVSRLRPYRRTRSWKLKLSL